ncbi:prostaglandin reductase 1-like [Amyelois transitella]|uniref:prostaglandin reductase 1-like n=1 Tax=Amyelois transitella TaxID=680683 RepID=UPI00298FC6E0|nr:prostaglandin reductase 1-like [Amyelois transitella]XP_060803062.1 prostaglandin reductase 1-like [Amyelois transitella]XP_060803063.1 prostaglandin reductase 1-like [Amyelois transitella]XP_060803064.1 prostaglandin reductase 1-like [Amyelois transitella]
MVVAQKYVVKKYFQGEPKISDYEIVKETLPPLKDGEILIKAEWISIDPYQRAYNSTLPLPYDQFSFQVGVVQESKDPNHPVGSRVVTHQGWCDYSIINMSEPILGKEHRKYALPDLQGLSPSLALGAVGMPGATAYLSFLEIGKPKPGDVVAITGAAGAVGSLVGQIAKIKGCKVIGFAGSDRKVEWLKKDLGFDSAYNYKTVNIANALREAAPDGVDIYFDNVGGEISSTIMYHMKTGGRVVIVGSISSYFAPPDALPKVTLVQPAILFKSLKLEGFLIWDWYDSWHGAFVELVKLIKSGKLKTPEHITEGYDKVFDAFIGMLNGENIGKAIVKV